MGTATDQELFARLRHVGHDIAAILASRRFQGTQILAQQGTFFVHSTGSVTIKIVNYERQAREGCRVSCYASNNLVGFARKCSLILWAATR